jgi:hypothetical protein
VVTKASLTIYVCLSIHLFLPMIWSYNWLHIIIIKRIDNRNCIWIFSSQLLAGLFKLHVHVYYMNKKIGSLYLYASCNFLTLFFFSFPAACGFCIWPLNFVLFNHCITYNLLLLYNGEWCLVLSFLFKSDKFSDFFDIAG